VAQHDGGTSSKGLAVLALVVAAAALAFALRANLNASGGDGDDSDLGGAESLENRISDLETRLEEIQRRAEAAERRSSSAEDLARDALGLAQRAMETARGGGEGGPTVVEGEGGIPAEERARVGREILDRIREGRFESADAWVLAQGAAEVGILERAKSEAEKYAALRTADPDAQILLGVIYTHWLMAIPEGPERSPWAQRALDAFEKAVKAAPDNWDALFHHAVNLSRWPASLGRQGTAIRALESLVQWQEIRDPKPPFLETYLILGDTYKTAGQLEKARDAWTRGLRIFPDNPRLKEALQ
jgi:tetratricopeptide (TPR) repeat protein